MKYLAILFCLTTSLVAGVARAADQPKLELKDGDRVAFIGDTFVEREAKDCYIETMLTSRFPDRNVTFRNLGYSADTVTGSARGLCAGWSTFEGPDKAFDRLRKLVAEFKPTVLLMNYGMTESFSGPEGIPTFTANYNKMLDELSKAAGTSPRIVLMSPNYHEDLGKPLPDPAEHNKNLKLYSDAIANIAEKRGTAFIDLFAITQNLAKDKTGMPLTSNGIHLTPYGYWRVAMGIENALGFSPRNWEVEVNFKFNPKSQVTIGAKEVGSGKTPLGMEFTVTDDMLPAPAVPIPAATPGNKALDLPGVRRIVVAKDLPAGSYDLKIDGHAVKRAKSEDFAAGVAFEASTDQADTLRKAIIAKNFDFFNYQRPDNDAYILAFRKGEQGKNAVEIPRFLPLVAEKEKEIAELRVPKPVKYSLELVK